METHGPGSLLSRAELLTKYDSIAEASSSEAFDDRFARFAVFISGLAHECTAPARPWPSVPLFAPFSGDQYSFGRAFAFHIGEHRKSDAYRSIRGVIEAGDGAALSVDEIVCVAILCDVFVIVFGIANDRG